MADAVPPRRGRSRDAREPLPCGWLGADAYAAATLLRSAMVEIRGVRHSESAADIPVGELARAFAGAGGAVLAAGAEHRPRRRAAAFRGLVESWALRGGPDLAPWFAEALRRRPGLLPDLPDAPPRVFPEPESAVLRLIKYAPAYTRYDYDYEAAALVHLAVPPPPGATAWRLHSHTLTPGRLRLATPAFSLTPAPPLGTPATFALRPPSLTVGIA
ncbi:hypothetical protein [Streptomyces sp. NPDC049040]|uniref:hypothetical protein n=1 Tax=Streptomyces sp. NPDC049040 TaxID=3365593 RepID=UPI0037214136